VAEPFANPPGYNSLFANVAMLKAGGKRGGFVRDRHGTGGADHRRHALRHVQPDLAAIVDEPSGNVFEGLVDRSEASHAVSLAQAKASSMRLRMRWETA
jgi:hypothetical protein